MATSDSTEATTPDVDKADDAQADDYVPPSRRSVTTFVAIVVAALAVVVIGTVTFLAGRATVSDDTAHNAADVGFLQDMIPHHAQAVDMARILFRGTDDPELAAFAYDILTTQQGQIGMMTGWLEMWNEPVGNAGRAMAWMGMEPMPSAEMPGMATNAQMQELADTEDPDALEVAFLQLMIPHHAFALVMSDAEIARGENPLVISLAEKIETAQRAEIEAMNAMLVARGADPIDIEQVTAHAGS